MSDLMISRRGAGGDSINKTPVFQYTGTYTLTDDLDNPLEQGQMALYGWKIRLLTSGVLTFSKLGSAKNGIDVFLVGGGGTAVAATTVGSNTYFSGGGGGYTTNGTATIATETGYQIVIGAGGLGYRASGGASTAFDLTANGATTKDGGSGGGYNTGAGGKDGSVGAGGTYGGKGQGTTTREFGDPGGKLYASGAAFGASDPEPNTGDGTGRYAGDASGGSGIVAIRNHRTVA